MPLIEYRLVIRNQADSADLLDVSTRRGDSAPYLAGPPSGDGAEFDPISGRSRSGSFTFAIIDPITSGTSRLVTSLLEDATGRPQLAALKATGYYAVDGGSWTVLHPGIVAGVRTSGGVFEVTVADVTLAERKATAFAPAPGETIADYLARWPLRGCILGGPVRGGGLPDAPDLGGWRMTVAQRENVVHANTWLRFVEGYGAPQFTWTSDPADLWPVVDKAAGRAQSISYSNLGGGLLTDPQETKRQPFPGLVVEVISTAGTTLGYFRPSWKGATWRDGVKDELFDAGSRHPGLFIIDTAPVLSLSASVRVRVFDILPSSRCPIYWYGHPVDLLAKLWSEAGLPYSASAIEAVRDTLGASLAIVYQITETQDLSPFLEGAIYGPFGIAVRANTAGELEPFTTRVAFGAVPSRTIDDDDVSCTAEGAPEGTAYDLDIGSAVGRVVFTYAPLSKDSDNVPMPDGISRREIPIERDNDDPYHVGSREVSFSIPGAIYNSGQAANAEATVDWADAMIYEMFDRFGRGIVTSEVPLLAGEAGDGVLLGEEIYDARSQTPNANKRQGDDVSVAARIGQVVRVTPTVTGPVAKVIDSGFWGQAPATNPTYTIGAYADAPQTIAELTITNAATLNTAGYHVRVQMAVGVAPAAEDYADALYLRAPNIPTAAVWLPEIAPGSTVWVRARSESVGGRPANWQAATSVNLTSLAAPSALTVTPDADGSKATATWTVGEADAFVDVYLRAGTDPDILRARLLPGSTRYTFEGLTPGGSYTGGVEHRHRVTDDVSARTEAAFTAGGTGATLADPIRPTGFSGSNGSYGLAVDSVETSGLVAFEEAVETGVGTGVYGSYTEVGRVDVTYGDWTKWLRYAPNDGLRRQLRARAVREGATSSGYTTAAVVTPWTVDVLDPYIAASQSTTRFITSVEVTGQSTATDEITVEWSAAVNIQPGDTYNLLWNWEGGTDSGEIVGVTSPYLHGSGGADGHGLDLSGLGTTGVMQYSVLVMNSGTMVGQSQTIDAVIDYV